MAVGTRVNCKYCLELKNNRCDGTDKGCLCRTCPRNLGQCLCVKYCRETESVLDLAYENYNDNHDDFEKYGD